MTRRGADCRPLGTYAIDQGDTSHHMLDVSGCRYLLSSTAGTVEFYDHTKNKVTSLYCPAGVQIDATALDSVRFAPGPDRIGKIRIKWTGAAATVLSFY